MSDPRLSPLEPEMYDGPFREVPTEWISNRPGYFATAFKLVFLADLRANTNLQGRSQLCTQVSIPNPKKENSFILVDRFCCLGRIAKLLRSDGFRFEFRNISSLIFDEGPGHYWRLNWLKDRDNNDLNKRSSFLPEQVARQLGFVLMRESRSMFGNEKHSQRYYAGLNDSGASFAEIADEFERNM